MTSNHCPNFALLGPVYNAVSGITLHSLRRLLQEDSKFAMILISFLVVFGLHRTYGVITALQPDNVESFVFSTLNNQNLCTRPCIEGEPPKVCYYKFTMENYNTLGGACGNCPDVTSDCFNAQCVPADGFERAIFTINRRLPGPTIQVCKNDSIVVDVVNKMKGSSLTMHWHGISQKKSPWMDGAPMVTQCPISEGQTFRYNFVADSAGTFWHHAQTGLSKADGLVGGLVVRQPDSQEPLRILYDFDLPSHLIVVQDWKHFTTRDMYPGLIKRHHVEIASDTFYLINGKGVDPNTVARGGRQTPVSVFQVQSGKRYRFRIVAASSLSCMFKFSVEGHKLQVISIDKTPIRPKIVDSIAMASGERYDVVIQTNQPVSSYKIFVEGYSPCNNGSQIAYLQYNNAPLPAAVTLPITDSNDGLVLNPPVSPCNNSSLSKEVCVSQLENLAPTPDVVRTGVANYRFLMNSGFFLPDVFKTGSYKDYYNPTSFPVVSIINNISYQMPTSPLLTQLGDVPPSSLCETCLENTYCSCTHLKKVPMNAVVEFLMADLVDPPCSRFPHVFHIHGYDFYIVEQGLLHTTSLAELQSRLAEKREIRDNLPMKDTIIVPRGGYTIARIYTDNPGFWMYHSNFDFHLASGMAAVIQVGELQEMLQPPQNFPSCKNYLPDVNNLL